MTLLPRLSLMLCVSLASLASKSGLLSQIFTDELYLVLGFAGGFELGGHSGGNCTTISSIFVRLASTFC